MSYSFADSLRAGTGCSILIMILLANCLQNCMTYAIAVCEELLIMNRETAVPSEELLMMDRGTIRNM
jgi:hypothetical protein